MSAAPGNVTPGSAGPSAHGTAPLGGPAADAPALVTSAPAARSLSGTVTGVTQGRARVKTVARAVPTFWERLYLPAILKGLGITFRRMFQKKITMQFPEERWAVKENYRGAPVLVSDDQGRPKCVACSLCEYVCPPKAIYIVPTELEPGNNVERGPAVFNINMLRCIFCGLCEEACPEEAIFMSKDYSLWGETRAELIHDKETLYRLGGVRPDAVKKWAHK